ncbi:bloom syndrome [Fusarium sporotrichioides]|uniref:Bloom syndrome n=1 Tax=Fusarium sporotrichioides TaxID=5514 RepID=A0A395S1K2_FUSSP|nr:bloom syndrome [Fusarium sporotrichioides]
MRYSEYKRDTDIVVSWLATTAKQYGYTALAEPSAATNKSTAPTSGRLKGKAHGKIEAKAKPAPALIALTPPQIVHYFARNIETEIPRLVLDYSAMYRMARGLLEKVRAQADNIGLPPMVNDTTDFAHVVGHVFGIAANEMAFESGQGQEVLDKVAMVIQEYAMKDLEEQPID